MLKGVVILRNEAATAELRGQVIETLSRAGWSCEGRQRFDGVQAVVFEAGDASAGADAESILALLSQNALLAALPLEIKPLDP